MKQLCALLLITAALSAQVTINENPSREFGQLRLLANNSPANGPNLVEGRELYLPYGIAFDTSVTPPIMYVADFGNNRVLAWVNPAAKQPGDLADKVIGQRDLFSTNAQGPGTPLSAGLRGPVAVAVDKNGNLYVVDAGNNRILRFPRPLQQSGDLLSTDLVIGQRTVSSGISPNEGLAQPTEKTVAFNNGAIYSASMAFDAQGNLWITDPVNNRVLRYPVAQLAPNTIEPAADLVLGQSNFTTGTVAPDPEGIAYQRNKSVIDVPSGLAFDQTGRLYVSDRRARVLYFPALSTGVPASRILGAWPDPPPGQRTSFPNSYNVGAFTPQGGQFASAEGIFTSGNNIFVSDQGDHRILRFGAPETWLAETATAFSPPALSVIGQADFTTGKAEHGALETNSGGFNAPQTAAFLGTDLWIADTRNNRVIAMPQSGSLVFGAATKVLGQFGLNYDSPNLLEGRELWVSNAGVTGGAVIVDKTSNPPHLYIADTFNNRVLGFRDARLVGTDSHKILEQKADLVIGQPDLLHSTGNYPSGDPVILSDTGLVRPVGLAIDAAGNLWVADQGNGRVLRFPSPFTQAAGSLQHATVVLGQRDFTAPPVKDAGISNMNAPTGLALLSNGSLAVSDVSHNRVVIFRRPANGDFTNYQNASLVLGQSEFSTLGSGNGPGQMRSPWHIAVDTSDRLYVADSGNNRMMVFTNLNFATNGATSAFQLPNFNGIFGIAVSPITGEIWVTNSNSLVVYRYPEFQQLQLNPTLQPTAQIGSGVPIALALDSFDNVIILEAINRVTFYYGKVLVRHGASFNTRPLAPGQLALLARLGKDIGFTAASATTNPWPTTLNDYQVFVNGVPAPIFRLDAPGTIQFMVPQSSPVSGDVDIIVQKFSTGEIVGAVTWAMAPANPGFYTLNAAGTGQAAATHPDGTVNSPQNPVARGGVVTFYLTGAGKVDGGPPDGMAPACNCPTPVKPVLGTSAGLMKPETILYSGLGAFAGGWQVNFQVPETVAPGNNVVVSLTLYDIVSNVGTVPQPILVTFAVK